MKLKLTTLKLTKQQIKLVEKYEKKGWDFYEGFDYDMHERIGLNLLKFKSPKMQQYAELAENTLHLFTESTIKHMVADEIAQTLVKQNLDAVEDKLYKTYYNLAKANKKIGKVTIKI